MPPQARSPGPITVKLQDEDVVKQIRSLNALFNPKAIGTMNQMVARAIGDLGKNLAKTIIGQSQALASVIEPVFTVLGIIADFFVLALLPQIKKFYQDMAAAAKDFITGARGAGAGGNNVDTTAMSGAFARFITSLVVAFVPLVMAAVDLLVAVIKEAGFIQAVAVIIALLAVTLIDAVVLIMDGVVLALTNMLKGDFKDELTRLLGPDVAGKLLGTLEGRANDLWNHVRQLGIHSFNLLVTGVTTVLEGLQNGGWIWKILIEVLKGVINWMFGKEHVANLGRAFDYSTGFGVEATMNRMSSFGRAFDYGWW